MIHSDSSNCTHGKDFCVCRTAERWTIKIKSKFCNFLLHAKVAWAINLHVHYYGRTTDYSNVCYIMQKLAILPAPPCITLYNISSHPTLKLHNKVHPSQPPTSSAVSISQYKLPQYPSNIVMCRNTEHWKRKNTMTTTWNSPTLTFELLT